MRQQKLEEMFEEIQSLTRLEVSVYRELLVGKTNPEIADLLNLSEMTISLIARNIVGKLGARDIQHAVCLSHALTIA